MKTTTKQLEIKLYGCQILHQKAEPVSQMTPEISALIDNMIYTMYEVRGCGLAAPQVGVPLRIFVCDADYSQEQGRDPMVFVNPEFIEFEGETTYEEGCLSFPDVYEKVKRFKVITLKYRDKNFKEHTLTATETLGIIIQHETDHLNGILLVDKMNPLGKMAQAFKLAKITDKAKKMTNEMVIL